MTEIGSNAIFTGPQKGLTTIGNHCYAYSGNTEASTSSQTVLSFATGQDYIIGEFTFNGFIQVDNVSIRQGAISLVFNNVIIANQLTGDANEDMIAYVKQKVLIPPNTFVEAKVVAASGDSDNFATVIFVGKTYNG